MATYVISDIHGEYEKFIQLLKKISFREDDTLYILGDVLDRGAHPIQVLLEMMKYPNIIPIIGNHELMAMMCLPFLNSEIEESSIAKLDAKMMAAILNWQENGSDTTLNEFRKLDKETRQMVIDYLGEFIAYEELYIGGKEFVLVHGGLDHFEPNKDLDEYSIYDLVWCRPDYNRMYYPDKYLVTGHTPTQLISSTNPGCIYQKNNHIAIDCGATFGGRLAAYCFETGEEFYVESAT